MVSILQDYTRLDELGHGAFATVYKVKHNKLGYVRAVRVLDKTISQGENDPVWIKFLAECKTLLRLGNGNNPHIVHVYQPLLREGKAFVEMDYVDGMNLHQYLDSNNGYIEVDDVLQLARAMGNALSYCHHDIFRACMSRDEDDLQDDPDDGRRVLLDDATVARLVKKYRVIHNDLHSGNIMRREDGSFVLLDFGLSIQDGDVLRSSRRRGGAPEYKAPEKWDNEASLTTQSDVFSLGVILYEMLTGHTPFKYNTREPNSAKAEYELSIAIKTAPVPSIIEARRHTYEATHPGKVYHRDYPQWIEDLILKCLEKNPKDRFACGHDLNAFIQQVPTSKDDAATASLRLQLEQLKKENQNLREENIRLKQEPDKRKDVNYNFIDLDINNYREASEQGDPYAQFMRAICYYHGYGGVKKSRTKAENWFKSSSAHGNIYATFHLCQYYISCFSEEKRTKAKNLFCQVKSSLEDKANTGIAYAQYCLGMCHYKGWGTDQDYIEAISWFRKAVKQGHAEAQYMLGKCYKKGSGVEKNKVEAVKWFCKAADQGEINAQIMVGDCFFYGMCVKRNAHEAQSWYRKAAEQGCKKRRFKRFLLWLLLKKREPEQG